MKTILTIAKKELRGYFISPIAYIYLSAFEILVHWFFLRNFFIAGQSSLRTLFSLVPWFYLFFIPAVAMGKWSEEKKQGTIETLFTLPITKTDVVLGKFFAGLGLIATALLLTFSLPLTVSLVGDLDFGPMIGGYLGLLLLGGAYLSIGLWISSLTENQIIAFIVSVLACFTLFAVGEPIFTNGLPSDLVAILQYASLSSHFESIARGVLDSRDLLYYFSMIGLFLFLNRRALEQNISRSLAMAVLIALLTFNFLASRHFIRFDLTENKAYTLSAATKKLLGGLEDLVTFRLYFTRDLPPALMNHRRDVEDILGEFKTHADGKIRVEFLDPQESPTQEQKMMMMGIPPVEINVIAKDKAELAKVYLGLSVHYGTEQEVIPVVQSIQNLEYQLSAAILKTTVATQPTLGWIGESPDYSYVKKYLERRFTINTIDEKNLDTLTPTQTAALLYTSPETLSDEIKKGIENYLEAGGNALFFVDPFAIGAEQGLQATARANPLEDLLKKYGVGVSPKLVLDQSNAMASFTGGIVTYHLPYPYWVQIRPENFDKEEPMVAELSSLVLPWTVPLSQEATLPEGVTVKKLFQSTPTAVTQEPSDQPLDPQAARDAFEAGVQATTPLGLFVRKKIGEEQEVKFILVGNARFIQNNFLEQFEENVLFLENGIDLFTIGSPLIGIRSKSVVNKPIALLPDLARNTLKTLNMILSPLFLALLALFVYFQRRSRAKRIKEAFST
ncbi:MAG: Gldg family protein [Deltaproteobacteria bacterium]|nr:Gldg family protein [Deltaproteobacteria bacterium]